MKKKITKIIIVSGVLLGLFGIPLSVYAKCPWCGASTHTSDHCNKYDKDGHPIVQGARQDGRVLEGGRWVNPNSRIDSERANENRGIRETSSSNESQATSSGAPTELTAHEKAIMEWKEKKKQEALENARQSQPQQPQQLSPEHPRSPQEALELITELKEQNQTLELGVKELERKLSERTEQATYYEKYARSLHTQLIGKPENFKAFQKGN